MAIQHRRGAGADFDLSKLLPGEFAIVQSDGSGAPDGPGAYICVAAGDVRRLAASGEIEASVEEARRAMAALQSALDDAHAALARAREAEEALALVPISDAQVDDVMSGAALDGAEVLTSRGLSRMWSRLGGATVDETLGGRL